MGGGGFEVEVVEEAFGEAVDPAVDFEFLAAGPGVLDDAGLFDVAGLVEDVELAEEVFLGFLLEAGEALGLPEVDAADVAEPVVDEAELLIQQRGADAAAAVVADDHDVLHFEDLDGVLEDGEAVEIGVVDDVGDVAVNEDLAGAEAEDFVGGDAAVGATDPEVFRALDADEFFEKVGLLGLHLGGPGAVGFEEMLHEAGSLDQGGEWARIAC